MAAMQRASCAADAAAAAVFQLLDPPTPQQAPPQPSSSPQVVFPSKALARVTQLLQWLCALVDGSSSSDVLLRIVVHAILADRSGGAQHRDAAAAAAAAAAADAALTEETLRCSAAPPPSAPACLCPLLHLLVRVACDLLFVCVCVRVFIYKCNNIMYNTYVTFVISDISCTRSSPATTIFLICAFISSSSLAAEQRQVC